MKVFKTATMTVEYKGKQYTQTWKWFKEKQAERYMINWMKDALCSIIHGSIYNEENYYDEDIRKEMNVVFFDAYINC